MKNAIIVAALESGGAVQRREGNLLNLRENILVQQNESSGKDAAARAIFSGCLCRMSRGVLGFLRKDGKG